MKKKILVISLVVSLVAVAALGATLAYFTDTSTVDNTFTLGNVDITLSEVVANDGDTQTQTITADDDEGVEGFTYESVVPGDVLTKAPSIKNTGSNDAYVFMKLTLSDESPLADLLPNLETQNVINFNATNWELISNDDEGGNRVIWIGYKTVLVPNASTVEPFTTISIPTDWDNDDMESFGENFSLQVDAYAIQSDNIASATAAFTALQAELA